MIINIYSAKCIGIDAVPVTIEINITAGIGIHLVGLADIAVKESLLRTMTALQSVGFRIPGKKIVINLAPADMHKSGSGYDLPIALGIIAASEQASLPGLGKYLVMGELGLDASLRDIPGGLPITELAVKSGLKGVILPVASALEAVEYREVEIYAARGLTDVIKIMQETEDVSELLVWNVPEYRGLPADGKAVMKKDYMDFSEIIGQEGAKRGLE
ncbi:MAG: magnesium chelatase, partial [Bacteroidales bacterium]|nr:magnesium chelatase [Bacteroidales bacterium]